MSTSIHLANSKGRDATIGIVPLKSPEGPKLGVLNQKIYFHRYLIATEKTNHEALVKQFSEDYSKKLIEGDPEVDFETVGLIIEHTQRVYLDGDLSLMYVDPSFIEIVFNPDNSEKERKTPVDTVMNVNIESPVRFSGKFIPIKDAVRHYAFRRKLQLRHLDGLTFDFLFEIAKELETSQSLMVVGSGDKGISPLIFQSNGRQYRGFLSGATQDKSYQLILHLSEMELKKPAISKSNRLGEAGS